MTFKTKWQKLEFTDFSNFKVVAYIIVFMRSRSSCMRTTEITFLACARFWNGSELKIIIFIIILKQIFKTWKFWHNLKISAMLVLMQIYDAILKILLEITSIVCTAFTESRWLPKTSSTRWPRYFALLKLFIFFETITFSRNLT